MDASYEEVEILKEYFVGDKVLVMRERVHIINSL